MSSLLKRLIVCLDVRNGRVTKGVQFKGNVDVGDPVEMAKAYCEDGVDELVFYDITASAEQRACDLEMVARAARELTIPFTVGGGIRGVEDMRAALLAGADKVSLNSLAVSHPEILTEGAKAFGRQCVVLGMDAKRVAPSSTIPSGYEIYVRGGRQATGRDALAWAKEAVERGAGEICLNAMDTDGVREGYELEITRLVSEAVDVPVIASGGAGTPQHIVDVFQRGQADAALVASMVHTMGYTCSGVKAALAQAGIAVR